MRLKHGSSNQHTYSLCIVIRKEMSVFWEWKIITYISGTPQKMQHGTFVGGESSDSRARWVLKAPNLKVLAVVNTWIKEEVQMEPFSVEHKTLNENLKVGRQKAKLICIWYWCEFIKVQCYSCHLVLYEKEKEIFRNKMALNFKMH